MTHPSKRKGNNFERELVSEAHQAGLSAERAYASNGKSLGHAEDVDLVVAGKRIQAKRRKAIAAFLRPSETVDAVAVREDHGETIVLVTWWEYLELILAAKKLTERPPANRPRKSNDKWECPKCGGRTESAFERCDDCVPQDSST